MKKIFRREKLSPENLKAVKQAAVEAKEGIDRTRRAGNAKGARKGVRREKYVAWNRLKRESDISNSEPCAVSTVEHCTR